MVDETSPFDDYEIDSEDTVTIEDITDDEAPEAQDVEIGDTSVELVADDDGDEVVETPKKIVPRSEQRIGQLTRKNKELREERDRLLYEQQQMREYLQSKEAKQQEEKKVYTEAALQSLKQEIQVAFDAGNTEAFMNAQERYLNARDNLMKQEPSAAPMPRTQTIKPSDTEVTWAERSGFKRWPEEAKKDVMTLYEHLNQKGMDPAEPEFWQTMDRKLKTIPNFDKLYTIFGEDEEEMPQNKPLTKQTNTGKLSLQRVSNPGRQSAIAGNVKNSNSGYKITNEDKMTMKMFGIDMSDKDAVKGFLKHGKGVEI